MTEKRFETLSTDDLTKDIPLPLFLLRLQAHCNYYEQRADAALQRGDEAQCDKELLWRAQQIQLAPQFLQVFHEEGLMHVPAEILDRTVAIAEEATRFIDLEDEYGIASLLVRDPNDSEPDFFEELAARARELENE